MTENFRKVPRLTTNQLDTKLCRRKRGDYLSQELNPGLAQI